MDCPAILSGSHTLSYSEYDTASAEYLEGCGEPRSEVNSCHQRYEEDPQVLLGPNVTMIKDCPGSQNYFYTNMTDKEANFPIPVSTDAYYIIDAQYLALIIYMLYLG